MMAGQERISRLASICGIAGPLLLVAYFSIPAFVAWPYSGASPSRLMAYASAHQSLFYAGAWLQGTGTLLCVVFFLALVDLASATGRLPGMLAIVSSAVLLAVVLVEGAFLIAVPLAASAGDAAAVSTTFELSNGAFLRVFPLAPATATYAALGLVILGSGVLHRWFGYAAIALAAAFELAGIAAIVSAAALIVIAALSAAQALWIAAAAAATWRKS